MAKISDNSSQNPITTQPETTANAEKGILGGRRVNPIGTKSFIDKSIKGASTKTLESRDVTTNNFKTLASLGLEKKWPELSKAIASHGNTVNNLTQIMGTLNQHNIELPSDIQQQVCNQFCDLSAIDQSSTLSESPTSSPVQRLALLQLIINQPENHDSPIGIVSHHNIEQFIDNHNLNTVNQEELVDNLSEKIYSIISEQIESLETEIISTSTDPELNKNIQLSQNERRIEENYRKQLLTDS